MDKIGSRDAVSYPENGHECCFQVEEDSFWFRHRNACIIAAVRLFPPVNRGVIYDVGGGNGFVAKGLISAGFDVVVVEPGEEGVKNAKERGIPVLCATTQTANFEKGSLPAVGLFDVLEHIEDDKAFLLHIHSLLKNDAPLFLTVPAHSCLWSGEDIFAGHFRRYTISLLGEILESAGFEILFGTYFFRFLPFPIFMMRALPYRLGMRNNAQKAEVKKDHLVRNGVLVKVLDGLSNGEAVNIRNKQMMRFGSSVLVIARKKGYEK